MKYKGRSINGLEFYNLLHQSDEFTSVLGKMILASSKLESQMIIYLKDKQIKINHNEATLGNLINLLKTKKLIDHNIIDHLIIAKIQRNYLTHNIYALLTDLIDETILERKDIIDSDVHTYVERASQLKENLTTLAEIFEGINKK
jgi:hypothetical protein|tara:strand:- start:149205 stop:149639 length:435 start_codon:yes stop_codon:yes gene_type:complete